MVLLRSRGLCRVHDGFRSELRRILRITAKCIFMRYLNLENSMRRTVLHSQAIPMFSEYAVLLMPLLYTIAAISVNAANAYICIICKYIFSYKWALRMMGRTGLWRSTTSTARGGRAMLTVCCGQVSRKDVKNAKYIVGKSR